MGDIELTEEAVARLLVGSEVEVSVDEPWDFEGPDGTNLLAGRVTDLGQDEINGPGSQWVKIEVTPFAAEGDKKVEHLEARLRHELPTGVIEQIASGETAIVHLDYGDQVGEEGDTA